jgi:hypothetical protein
VLWIHVIDVCVATEPKKKHEEEESTGMFMLLKDIEILLASAVNLIGEGIMILLDFFEIFFFILHLHAQTQPTVQRVHSLLLLDTSKPIDFIGCLNALDPTIPLYLHAQWNLVGAIRCHEQELIIH